MDRHTRWLRRRIVAATTRRLVAEAAAVCVVSVASLVVANVPLGLIGPWAATIVQIWVAGRIAGALVANPLNHRFLDHYANREMEFDPRPYEPVATEDLDEEDPDPVLLHRSNEATSLPSVGLHPVTTLVSSGNDRLGLDVYQPINRLAVAIVSATTLLATRLDDGRILVTTSVLTAPQEQLVVNFWPGAAADDLAARHAGALRSLHRMGTKPIRCGPELAADVLVIEREAFAGLGPFLGSFLSLDAKPKPHLLQTAIDPRELIKLALSGVAGQRRTAAAQAPSATTSSNSTNTTDASPHSASAAVRASASS